MNNVHAIRAPLSGFGITFTAPAKSAGKRAAPAPKPAPKPAGLDLATLRATQAAILAQATAAIATASTDPVPVRGKSEASDAFQKRLDAHADACGFVTFNTRTGTARVRNSRDCLERFARKVKAGHGYKLAAGHGIGRDRETHAAMTAAPTSAANAWMSDDYLRAEIDKAKRAALQKMRDCLNAKKDYPPAARVADAGEIDRLQREAVRRGLLDATDHDKVNADPTQDADADADAAPAASAPKPASAPQAAPKPASAPGAVSGRDPGIVECVEAIETPAGGLYLVAFNAEYDIVRLFSALESAGTIVPPMIDALIEVGTGNCAGWPEPEAAPQAVYDAVTQYPTRYRVIGRWWRKGGLDLRDLDLAGAAGRAWSGGLDATPTALAA